MEQIFSAFQGEYYRIFQVNRYGNPNSIISYFIQVPNYGTAVMQYLHIITIFILASQVLAFFLRTCGYINTCVINISTCSIEKGRTYWRQPQFPLLRLYQQRELSFNNTYGYNSCIILYYYVESSKQIATMDTFFFYLFFHYDFKYQQPGLDGRLSYPILLC